MQAKNTAECNMKKYLTLLLLLLLASIAVYSQSIGVTVIAAPVGGSLSLDSYVWNIAFANDGVTSYLNDQQSIMTIKSGTKKNFHVDFSSQNLGYVKQGSNQIPYFLKATLITSGYTGIVGTPPIIAGYVQLTSTQTITFNKRTGGAGIQFSIGFQIPAYIEFYESGNYTDVLTISYAAP